MLVVSKPPPLKQARWKYVVRNCSKASSVLPNKQQTPGGSLEWELHN